jgi:membrane associated rhomboid family serine protease
MFFPYADDNPAERSPVVTLSLIATNVAIFLFQFLHPAVVSVESLGEVAMPGGVTQFGAIPAAITGAMPSAGPLPAWATLATCMFLHSSWPHVLTNMWFLWIFGNNVEDRMGPVKFTFFYVVCGVVATLAHVFVAPRSEIPLVGASGAISGVLAAYIVLFPKARVRTLIFAVFIVTTISVPAWLFLGFHFLTNLYLGMDSIRTGAVGTGGVATIAHVGGYGAGFVLVFALTSPRDWFRGPGPSAASMEAD